jgi:hypothetical protein
MGDMRVIAIDPGAKGGLACIDKEDASSKMTLVEVIDMPSLDTLDGCITFMAFIGRHYTASLQVIVEVQRCRGGNSALATWNHARHYGKLETCLLMSCANTVSPHQLIEPTVWMRKVKDTVGDVEVQGLDSTKARTWTLARQLFPDAVLVGPRGRKKDGRADAICMGWYYLTHVA